jgi:peptidoglycan/xylan/chitin deacetylase (PgdA/CDA1 family)
MRGTGVDLVGGLPVLTYHAIGRECSPLATEFTRFTETLLAFLEAGHRVVNLADWIAEGRPVLARAFALAFDDGLRSILPAVELLMERQLPATVFLVTGFMDGFNTWPGQPRWVPVEATLGWSEAVELSDGGIHLASHGRSHQRMDRLAPIELEVELRSARAEIEDRTGRPCPLLAYPYGRSSRSVRRASARCYAAAFGSTLARARKAQDPHDLARIDAYYLRDRRVLGALIEGRADVWLRVRRGLRTIRQGGVSAFEQLRGIE